MKNLLVTNLVVSVLTMLGVGYMLTFGVPLGTGGEELQTALITTEKSTDEVTDVGKLSPAATRIQTVNETISGLHFQYRYRVNYVLGPRGYEAVGATVEGLKVLGPREEVEDLMGLAPGLAPAVAVRTYTEFITNVLTDMYGRIGVFVDGYDMSVSQTEFTFTFDTTGSNANDIIAATVAFIDGDYTLQAATNLTSGVTYDLDYYTILSGDYGVIGKYPIPILADPGLILEPILEPVEPVDVLEPLHESAYLSGLVSGVWRDYRYAVPVRAEWVQREDQHELVKLVVSHIQIDPTIKDEFLAQLLLSKENYFGFIEALDASLKDYYPDFLKNYAHYNVEAAADMTWGMDAVSLVEDGHTFITHRYLSGELKLFEAIDDSFSPHPAVSYSFGDAMPWLAEDSGLDFYWGGAMLIADAHMPQVARLMLGRIPAELHYRNRWQWVEASQTYEVSGIIWDKLSVGREYQLAFEELAGLGVADSALAIIRCAELGELLRTAFADYLKQDVNSLTNARLANAVWMYFPRPERIDANDLFIVAEHSPEAGGYIFRRVESLASYTTEHPATDLLGALRTKERV